MVFLSQSKISSIEKVLRKIGPYYIFVKQILLPYFYFIKAFVSGCKPGFCHVLVLIEGFVATEAEEHHLTTPFWST